MDSEAKNTIEYAGPGTKAKRGWRWVVWAFVLFGVAAFVFGFGWELWPRLVEEHSLRVQAAQDVMAASVTVPLSAMQDGTDVPIFKVLVVNESLRIRAVSNSHHNQYISYHGATYVNVNNKLFYRRGGHCAPGFDCPLWLTPQTTEEELKAALIKKGYEQIGGPKSE